MAPNADNYAAIQVALEGLSDVTRGLKQLQEGTEDLKEKGSRSFQDLAGSVDTAVRSIMNLGSAGVLGAMINSLTQLAARNETLKIVLDQVGKNVGYLPSSLQKYEEALRKTGITISESRANLTRMMQANLDLAKSTDLARVAQNAAVIAGTNSSEAFQGMLHGIVTLQPEIIRMYGIIINQEVAWAEYARSIGKTVSQLTGAEKQQATMNEVLKQSWQITGVYEASMETAGKKMQSLKRYVEDTSASFGQQWLPAMGLAVDAATSLLKWMFELPNGVKTVIAALASAGAAVVAFKGALLALTAIGSLTGMGGVIGAITASLGGWPVLLAAAGIALLGFVATTKPAQEFFKSLGEMIGWVGTKLRDMVGWLTDAKDTVEKVDWVVEGGRVVGMKKTEAPSERSQQLISDISDAFSLMYPESATPAAALPEPAPKDPGYDIERMRVSQAGAAWEKRKQDEIKARQAADEANKAREKYELQRYNLEAQHLDALGDKREALRMKMLQQIKTYEKEYGADKPTLAKLTSDAKASYDRQIKELDEKIEDKKRDAAEKTAKTRLDLEKSFHDAYLAYLAIEEQETKDRYARGTMDYQTYANTMEDIAQKRHETEISLLDEEVKYSRIQTDNKIADLKSKAKYDKEAQITLDADIQTLREAQVAKEAEINTKKQKMEGEHEQKILAIRREAIKKSDELMRAEQQATLEAMKGELDDYSFAALQMERKYQEELRKIQEGPGDAEYKERMELLATQKYLNDKKDLEKSYHDQLKLYSDASYQVAIDNIRKQQAAKAKATKDEVAAEKWADEQIEALDEQRAQKRFDERWKDYTDLQKRLNRDLEDYKRSLMTEEDLLIQHEMNKAQAYNADLERRINIEADWQKIYTDHLRLLAIANQDWSLGVLSIIEQQRLSWRGMFQETMAAMGNFVNDGKKAWGDFFNNLLVKQEGFKTSWQGFCDAIKESFLSNLSKIVSDALWNELMTLIKNVFYGGGSSGTGSAGSWIGDLIGGITNMFTGGITNMFTGGGSGGATGGTGGGTGGGGGILGNILSLFSTGSSVAGAVSGTGSGGGLASSILGGIGNLLGIGGTAAGSIGGFSTAFGSGVASFDAALLSMGFGSGAAGGTGGLSGLLSGLAGSMGAAGAAMVPLAGFAIMATAIINSIMGNQAETKQRAMMNNAFQQRFDSDPKFKADVLAGFQNAYNTGGPKGDHDLLDGGKYPEWYNTHVTSAIADMWKMTSDTTFQLSGYPAIDKWRKYHISMSFQKALVSGAIDPNGNQTGTGGSWTPTADDKKAMDTIARKYAEGTGPIATRDAKSNTWVPLATTATITPYNDPTVATGRASGGPVYPGQTYLVGEDGPEILRWQNYGGYVYPNKNLPRVLMPWENEQMTTSAVQVGSGANNITVNVTGNQFSSDIDVYRVMNEASREMIRRLRTNRAITYY